MGGACTTPQEVEYEVVLHTYNACTGPAQAFLGLLGGGGAYDLARACSPRGSRDGSTIPRDAECSFMQFNIP